MYVPETYTLHIEEREDEDGIWLCVDNGQQSIPVAQFVSEESIELFRKAVQIAFVKAHTMGMMGI